jgi:hypothetical protein
MPVIVRTLLLPLIGGDEIVTLLPLTVPENTRGILLGRHVELELVVSDTESLDTARGPEKVCAKIMFPGYIWDVAEKYQFPAVIPFTPV